MPVNPYSSYSEQAILTMTPGELLVKLFDETEKCLNLAIMYIESNDVVNSHNNLMKAQRIVKHLEDTLVKDYSFSTDLIKLYDFILTKLQQANIKKDIAIINETIPIISELRQTFAECDRVCRSQSGNIA